MALQTSGPISLADIAGEFGGYAPHSISEYRGLGGTPASGPISFSDFYGAAAISLGFASNYSGSSPLSTGSKTVSGIPGTINVTRTVTNTVGSAFVSMKKNGAFTGPTFTLTNGDVLEVIMSVFSGSASGDVNFLNNSNGDALIGQFSFSLTA